MSPMSASRKAQGTGTKYDKRGYALVTIILPPFRGRVRFCRKADH